MEYDKMEEETSKNKQDMKQIIRYSHSEELMQDVVDVFIKKVTVCKGNGWRLNGISRNKENLKGGVAVLTIINS